MLSIRMKRLGRKGHPTYRVVVQDSRQSPTSGKFVALLGSYDPHTKQSSLVKEKAEFYLNNGAQPSDRVVSLFKAEKITLPSWVKQPTEKKKTIRNPEKLRKNQPEDSSSEQPKAEQQSESKTEANDENSQQSADADSAEEKKDTTAKKDQTEDKTPDQADADKNKT